MRLIGDLMGFWFALSHGSGFDTRSILRLQGADGGTGRLDQDKTGQQVAAVQ